MFEILAIDGLTPVLAVTIFGVIFFKFTTGGRSFFFFV